MRQKIGFLILPFLASLAFFHCDLVEYNFTNPYSGFTETDSAGNIISTDSDDWRLISTPHSTLPPNLSPEIRPAYPNPAKSHTYIYLRVENDVTDLDIHIEDRQQKSVRILQKGFLPQGTYRFLWYLDDDEGNPLENDLYRCRISFIQDGFRFSSYGDIKIER